jgi:hypothetical protein
MDMMDQLLKRPWVAVPLPSVEEANKMREEATETNLSTGVTTVDTYLLTRLICDWVMRMDEEGMCILRDMITVLEVYDGGHGMDGHTTLANFCACAERARAYMRRAGYDRGCAESTV